MPTKTIIVILVVAALAAAGWYFRDTALLRGAASSVEGYVKNTLVDNSSTVVKGKRRQMTPTLFVPFYLFPSSSGVYLRLITALAVELSAEARIKTSSARR